MMGIKMYEDNTKILIKGDKIVTPKALFGEEAKAGKKMARISFEEKIKALVTLQELAYRTCGKKM